MKKADFILIAAVIIVAAAFLISKEISKHNQSEENHLVQIMSNQEIYGIYNLDENQVIEFSNEYGNNVIIIDKYTVYVQTSDCVNQICVNEGVKSQTGDVIVCLPHKLVITIL